MGQTPHHRNTKWTDEVIIAKLKTCQHKEYSSMDVYNNHKNMCDALCRRFGGLDSACDYYGIPRFDRAPRIIKDEYLEWPSTRVISEILAIHQSGGNIASNAVIEYNRPLVAAAKRRFRTWNKALEASGVPIVRPAGKTDWSKEKVLEEVRNLLSKGVPFRRNKLKKEVRGLCGAISKYVGTMEDLKRELGVCILTEKPPMPYVRPDYAQILIDDILTRYHEGLPLNYDSIRNTGFRDRARTHFGGWRNAIEAAGLNYDDMRIDTEMASYSGYLFEDTFAEILTRLGVVYTQNKQGTLQPDFVLDGNHWIDAKLSEWTAFGRNTETIERYEPHCKSLTIVFLRGDTKCDRMVTPKTRLLHVSHYVNQLSDVEQRIYGEKLRNIETAVAA